MGFVSKRRLIGIVVALAVVIALVPVVVAVAAPSGRSTLAGSKPSWANSKNYQVAADPSASTAEALFQPR